jgi:hypothetical protein
MPSWIVLIGTIAISLVSAYGFLLLRCRGTGNPLGRRARRWAITIVAITSAASTGVGLAAIAAGGHTIAAYVGLILPSGLWLGKVSGQHSRHGGSGLPQHLVALATLPLRRLDDRMGDDIQDWCDARLRAAARKPRWLSDAAEYYDNQVGIRLKDGRARDQLTRWRESIGHKIAVVRLIGLETTTARLKSALQDHPATRDSRKYAVDDLPRLASRLIAEAENELHLFLALIYRLGYHKLLIYPFRPQPLRRTSPAPGGQAAGREPAHPEPVAPTDTSAL